MHLKSNFIFTGKFIVTVVTVTHMKTWWDMCVGYKNNLMKSETKINKSLIKHGFLDEAYKTADYSNDIEWKSNIT